MVSFFEIPRWTGCDPFMALLWVAYKGATKKGTLGDHANHMWHTSNSTSFQFRIFACNSLCRRWHVFVYPGFIRICLFFSMHWTAETTFHSLTTNLERWNLDMKSSHFGMDVVISFEPGELHIRWHYMASPTENSKTFAKQVLLDFSKDSHGGSQTLLNPVVDHSGGRWRHRTLPSFKISSLQRLGGGDVASRCVTITSQPPEAGHIATSWSGHCGETRHEEKGAWCTQWAHRSDDQMIDASKVPHTMTVAELKRLAHLLFKQVGYPQFLSCLMIYPPGN